LHGRVAGEPSLLRRCRATETRWLLLWLGGGSTTTTCEAPLLLRLRRWSSTATEAALLWLRASETLRLLSDWRGAAETRGLLLRIPLLRRLLPTEARAVALHRSLRRRTAHHGSLRLRRANGRHRDWGRRRAAAVTLGLRERNLSSCGDQGLAVLLRKL
jgi:hypothetical protein